MMEQPNAVWKTILINGQAENKITGYIDLAKFHGDTPLSIVLMIRRLL